MHLYHLRCISRESLKYLMQLEIIANSSPSRIKEFIAQATWNDRVSLEKEREVESKTILISQGLMPLMSEGLDICELAKNWATPCPAEHVHLLKYRFLFSPTDIERCFRTFNHLKMRAAHSAADKSHRRHIRDDLTGAAGRPRPGGSAGYGCARRPRWSGRRPPPAAG